MVFSACIFSITRLNTLNLHAIEMNQLFRPNFCTALDHITNVMEFGTTVKLETKTRISNNILVSCIASGNEVQAVQFCLHKQLILFQ